MKADQITTLKVLGIDLLTDRLYRVSWRVALGDGREWTLSALVEAQSGGVWLEEPLRSWTREVFNSHRSPQELRGDDRLRWLVCSALHHQLKQLTRSGALRIATSFLALDEAA